VHDFVKEKREEKKRKCRVGSEMVLTVLRHSFMGTSAINVAACLFQREIPSLNVVVFLVPLSQRVSPSCSTSFFPLCPLFTLTKTAHVSSFNYTSALLSPPPSLGLLFTSSIFTSSPSFHFFLLSPSSSSSSSSSYILLVYCSSI